MLKDKVTEILTALGEQIKANMSAKGVNASGRTSRSIRVVEYDGGVKLISDKSEKVTIETPNGSIEVGVAPMQTTEIGREGGRVPRGFYYIIRQWTKDKGLTFTKESERGTFAYFLAQKIAREGTARHRSPIDVYSQDTLEAMERIKDEARVEASNITKGIKINIY